MVLSFLENVISVCWGPTHVWGTMTEKVLVTGGFGLVGSQTVRRLAADGHRVVATDLGTPAQRKAAESLPAGAEASWANLTDQRDVDRLVAEVSPDGDRPPGRGDPAADLSQPRTRSTGQCGRDRGATARRAVQRPPAALRVGFQQRGLRIPQSASSSRAVDCGLSAASRRISTAPTRSRPKTC